MLATGYFRLGTYVKFIPYPVTVGFTGGIAVVIFASQLRELFGLTLAEKEPGRTPSEADGSGRSGRNCKHFRSRRIAARDRHDRRAETFPALLAGHADRRYVYLNNSRAVRAPGGNDRHPIRWNTPNTSTSRPANLLAGTCVGCFSRGDFLDAARRHRIPSLRRRRRWHDRQAASLQLRVGRAAVCQYRFRSVWRVLRHGDDRADGDQCARPRIQPANRVVMLFLYPRI